MYDPIAGETKRALRRVGLLGQREFKHLLHLGTQSKPVCYGIHHDEHIQRVRLLYEGKGRAVLSEWLRKVYPETWDQMPQASVPITRARAQIDATVYDRKTNRWIVRDGKRLYAEPVLDKEGNVVHEASEAAQQFDETIENARMDSRMLEFEKRVNASNTHVIKIDVDERKRRLVLRGYWSCDVYVVPHPSFPEDDDYALAVIFRIGGGRGIEQSQKKQSYEVWTRRLQNDEYSIDWEAGWRRQFADGQGNTYEPPEGIDWKGSAPWVFYHRGIPEGSPFVDVDRDSVDRELAVNEAWTNYFHTQRFQAHDELVYKSKTTKKKHLITGPGQVTQIREGEELSNITRNPKLRETVDGLDAFTRVGSKADRMPEDALSKEKAVPMTGVAREITWRQYEKAGRERELFARAMEEGRLLGLMVEMSDRYLDTSIYQEGDRYRMAPDERVESENAAQRDARMDTAVDRGEISPARGAVEKNLYPDEESAAEVGLPRGIARSQDSGASGPAQPTADPPA